MGPFQLKNCSHSLIWTIKFLENSQIQSQISGKFHLPTLIFKIKFPRSNPVLKIYCSSNSKPKSQGQIRVLKITPHQKSWIQYPTPVATNYTPNGSNLEHNFPFPTPIYTKFNRRMRRFSLTLTTSKFIIEQFSISPFSEMSASSAHNSTPPPPTPKQTLIFGSTPISPC